MIAVAEDDLGARLELVCNQGVSAEWMELGNRVPEKVGVE